MSAEPSLSLQQLTAATRAINSGGADPAGLAQSG